jgi:PST family polysaccharide transporter/lipopolysaccharide exporter
MPSSHGPAPPVRPAPPVGQAPESVEGARLPFARSELRIRTARGIAVNTVALVIVEGLALAQGLIVARILGPRAIGLYGIVSITVMTLIALKQVGIDEAFVAQDEPDQAREFSLAFTLELALAVPFALGIAAAAPVLASVYHDHRLLALTLAFVYLPIAFALQAPTWVFFRRMDFVRQRTLQAVVPLVTFAVTVPLAAAGVGVWSLVIGAFAGNLAAVVLALRASPYPLRLAFDRSTARRYVAFSGSVFVVTLGGLIIGQGQVLAFKLHDGLVATGFLSLALVLTRYANRADMIIAPAIYPVVCALRDRIDSLERMFETAVRASAVWSLGLGAGFVLFAPDLVKHLLGARWAGATLLLQGLAVVAALYQLGFCWIAFARGMGRPGLPAIEAVVAVIVFAGVALPALLLSGRGAFVAAMISQSIAILLVRRVCVPRLLPGVRLEPLLARCLWPLVPACAAVGAIRLASGGGRTLAQAAVELAIFIAVYTAATWERERHLFGELRRSLRPGAAPA